MNDATGQNEPRGNQFQSRPSPLSDNQLLAHLLMPGQEQAAPPGRDEELLRDLLAQQAPPPRAPADRFSAPFPVSSPSPAPVLPPPWPWQDALRTAVVALVIIVGVGGLALLGQTTHALMTIQENLQAMQLPTETAGPVISPASEAGEGEGPVTVTMTVPLTMRLALAGQTIATPALDSDSDSNSNSNSPGLSPTPQQVSLLVPSPGPPVTVLVLGIDRRPGETIPARSDTVLVVRAEPEQQRLALLSLPRDLVVDVPGYGRTRLNAAHAYGELYGEDGGGTELARGTVGHLLDIPIDYVVYLNFQGFIKAIDAIGGITVDVEHELYDPHYPTMDYGYMEAHFLPGPQRMDGETALIYARIRHMDSDFERMRRQQQVMTSILEQVRERHALERLQHIADLTTALRDYIHTDVPPRRLVGLAWAFRNLSPDAVERYVFGENQVVMYADPNDPYALLAQPGAVEEMVQRLMEGEGEGEEPEEGTGEEPGTEPQAEEQVR